MLAEALGRHSKLYMLPQESKVLPYFAQRFSDTALAEPLVRARMAQALGATRAFYACNGNANVELGPADALPPNFAGIVDALYRRFARDQGKERWGDKSPMNLQHITLLGERFPHASFVHIYRDGRDAAQSFHRRWRQNPRRSIWRWKHAVREGRRQGQLLGPERYMEVSYEMLTADPQKHLAQVCSFLGLSFEPALLDASMRWMDSQTRASAQGRIIPNRDRWRSYFDADEIDTLESIAGRLLAELGYETKQQGDSEPNRWLLQAWQLMDRWHFTVDHFRRYGWHGTVAYAKRVVDARRQARVNRY